MSTSTLKSELLSDQDRELIMATQAGLPLVSDPWTELGDRLGMPASEVLERFQKMQASGVIRRVAAVPNHYKL
ncbi:MAG: AsnC family transcriptional regulator, partial [Marinobacter sp. T13-3]